MEKKERENFYRNTIFIVDFTKCAFVDLLELNLTMKHLSFEEFLNQNQHDLYHLCYKVPRCCQCICGQSLSLNGMLSKPQLEVLFERSGIKLSCHKHERHADFCCSKAKVDISTNILDVTLSKCLLINFCADVFWYSCLTLCGITLEDFLNMNKHNIYHLIIGQNSYCCQCLPGYVIPTDPSLTQDHWDSLFNALNSKCESCSRHTTCSSKICEMTAIKGISPGKLDPYVADILLKKFCAVHKAFNILIGERNSNYGHAKETKMSDDDYNKCRSKSEPALLQLAAVCQKEEETKQKLHDLQQRPLDENAKAVLESLEIKVDSIVACVEILLSMKNQRSEGTMAEAPRNEIRLVMIGKTGNGKSRSCNTILGQNLCPSGCSSKSKTKTCMVGYAQRFGRNLCLVDTPGLQDYCRTNEDVQKEIQNCIKLTTPGLHAIIIVVPLNRFTEDEEKTMNSFCEHFGKKLAQYAIVLFTRFDDMKEEMRKDPHHTGMQGFIEELDTPMKEFLGKCGNRYIAFDNKLEGTSADSQVQRLLDIVDNMVRENGGSHYTDVEYQRAEVQLQKKIAEMKKKIEQVRMDYEQKNEQLELEMKNLRKTAKEKTLIDRVCDFGKKVFRW